MTNHGHFEISFPLRSFLGQYPLLYYPIYNLNPKNNRLAVKKDTQLIIEGYPRSANTFAVLAFNHAQPAKLNTAHHMHVPAQVIRGVNWGIPTLVLIRNPIDAAISFVIRDNRISITQALECYISFYERVYPYKLGYVLAQFEEVINNYSLIIDRVNTRFKTSFTPITPTGKDLEQIFCKADNFEKGSESKVSRPSSTRSAIKKELVKQINSKPYSNLVKKAKDTYYKISSI